MKEKISYNRDLKIKQDLWQESPCSRCAGSPCCRNLPLAPVRLNSQSDFINLLLISSYHGVYPALKQSGEWTIYLGRDCRFLDPGTGKCSIHKETHQSLICKTYDAHNCWYTDAFCSENYSTMVPFDTERMIWFEKRYGLIKNRFETEIDWEDLCSEAIRSPWVPDGSDSGIISPWSSNRLAFKKSRSDQFLFLPPYKLPETRSHFELLSFRLGFPGIALAITDTCWSFLVTTRIDQTRLDLIRREYYPAIGYEDGAYSFDSILKQYRPFSGAGEQWIVLQRDDLKTLIHLTEFDSSGRVHRRPRSSEILHALQPRSPDRAA